MKFNRRHAPTHLYGKKRQKTACKTSSWLSNILVQSYVFFFQLLNFYGFCKSGTLLKTHSSTGVFLWILENFKEHLFRRTLAQWVAASVLTLLLSWDNLLTDYQELSYWQFNRNLSICIWQLNSSSKKLIHVQ